MGAKINKTCNNCRFGKSGNCGNSYHLIKRRTNNKHWLPEWESELNCLMGYNIVWSLYENNLNQLGYTSKSIRAAQQSDDDKTYTEANQISNECYAAAYREAIAKHAKLTGECKLFKARNVYAGDLWSITEKGGEV